MEGKCRSRAALAERTLWSILGTILGPTGRTRPLLLVPTTSGRLSALVPRLVPLLLRLNDGPTFADHAQGYGTNKALHAVGPYPGESAMVQVDR